MSTIHYSEVRTACECGQIDTTRAKNWHIIMARYAYRSVDTRRTGRHQYDKVIEQFQIDSRFWKLSRFYLVFSNSAMFSNPVSPSDVAWWPIKGCKFCLENCCGVVLTKMNASASHSEQVAVPTVCGCQKSIKSPFRFRTMLLISENFPIFILVFRQRNAKQQPSVLAGSNTWFLATSGGRPIRMG